MNLFVLSYDRVVGSTFGHTIDFKKDVPTHVPPIAQLEELVQSFGAQRYEGDVVEPDASGPDIPEGTGAGEAKPAATPKAGRAPK
jgi:hypothetical protein